MFVLCSFCIYFFISAWQEANKSETDRHKKKIKYTFYNSTIIVNIVGGVFGIHQIPKVIHILDHNWFNSPSLSALAEGAKIDSTSVSRTVPRVPVGETHQILKYYWLTTNNK